MGRKRKGRMSMRDAMSLVPDDLPDGAFFAMAHEIAGLDYGDGFDELANEAFEPHETTPSEAEADKRAQNKARNKARRTCDFCKREFGSVDAMRMHRRMKHAKRLAKEARQ